MKRRAISDKSIKILFALSGNRCAFPNCKVRLVVGQTVVGQICHIKAASPGGPRYDQSQKEVERSAPPNLILFCPTHLVITHDVTEYPAERLLKFKSRHEEKYGGDDVTATDEEIAAIAKKLEEPVALAIEGAVSRAYLTNEALQKAREIDERQKYILSLLQSASEHFHNDRIRETIADLKNLFSLQSDGTKNFAASEIAFALGVLFLGEGFMSEANRWLNHAFEHVDPTQIARVVEIRLYRGNAYSHSPTPDFYAAETELREAFRLSEKHLAETPLLAMRVADSLAFVTLRLGRMDEAGLLMQRAIEIAATCGDDLTEYIAVIQTNLATLLLEQGRLAESEEVFEIALHNSLLKPCKDLSHVVKILHSLGEIAIYNNCFDNADRFLLEAEAFIADSENYERSSRQKTQIQFLRAILSNTRGRLHLRKKEPTTAIEYFNRAIDLAKSSQGGDQSLMIGEINDNISECYLELGDKQKALQHLRILLDSYREAIGPINPRTVEVQERIRDIELSLG